METEFKIWRTNRKLYQGYFEKYALEQLNTIPEGFKNNLIWNIGHIIVAQQGLVYSTSGVKWHISKALYEQYKPGSHPTGNTSQAEVDELKKLLTDLIDKTETDYKNGLFKGFTPFKTGTGYVLQNTDEAIAFNNYHEGLHLGMMMSMRRFIL